MEVYESSEDLERTKNGASSKGTSSRDNPLQKTIHWTRERTKSFRDTLQRWLKIDAWKMWTTRYNTRYDDQIWE